MQRLRKKKLRGVRKGIIKWEGFKELYEIVGVADVGWKCFYMTLLEVSDID